MLVGYLAWLWVSCPMISLAISGIFHLSKFVETISKAAQSPFKLNLIFKKSWCIYRMCLGKLVMSWKCTWLVNVLGKSHIVKKQTSKMICMFVVSYCVLFLFLRLFYINYRNKSGPVIVIGWWLDGCQRFLIGNLLVPPRP